MIGANVWMIPSWGNVTLIEAIWTAFGICASVIPLVLGVGLFKSWKQVHNISPALATVAWSHLRRELVRLVQGAAILIVGIYSCLEPSPYGAFITPVGILLTVSLFLIAFLSIAQSLLDRHDRNVVMHMLEQEQPFT